MKYHSIIDDYLKELEKNAKEEDSAQFNKTNVNTEKPKDNKEKSNKRINYLNHQKIRTNGNDVLNNLKDLERMNL